jgi:pimeloyl-ACP methyl ester carboxylesterase
VTTFVLVHGAWHGATAWRPVALALRDAGHTVIAHDLPGCGGDARYPASYFEQDWAAFETERSPLADIALQDWAAAVEGWVKEARSANGGPVVLVAHSLGGLAVTLAANRVFDQLAHIVYLTAYCVTARPNAIAYFQLPENREGLTGKLGVSNPAVTGAARINPHHPDAGYQRLMREAFYGDILDEAAAELIQSLSTDTSARVLFDDARGLADRWGRVPRTFIRCTQDRTCPIDLQDVFIAEADARTPDNRFRVETLESSHSPYASQPDKVAGLLLAVA